MRQITLLISITIRNTIVMLIQRLDYGMPIMEWEITKLHSRITTKIVDTKNTKKKAFRMLFEK